MEFITTNIGDIAESIQTGKTPTTKEPLYYDGDILWVTPSDLKGQQYISDTNTKISELAILDNHAFLYKENTVLINCIGAGLGKTVIVKQPVTSNQQITGIRVKENIILPKFFYYWVKRNKEYLSFKANKVTVPILNNTNFKKLKISFPKSLEFQRKVVSQLDNIQELINKKIEILNVLDKLNYSVYYQIFGSPIIEKSKWSTKKLSEIGEWKTGGTPDTNNPQNYEGNIPWFTSGELGNVFLEDSLKHISTEALKNSNAKLIEPNNILIGLYDTAAFKMSISTNDCTCNQAIIFGKLKEEVNTIFVYYTLLLCKDFYLKKRKGARQKNLNASFIKNIEIIYPTNKKDKDKVSLFLSFHTLINEIWKKQNKSLALLQELFQCHLYHAFDPDTEIDEEHIFKDLIKKFSVRDIQGNKKRLQYLIDLFDKQNFDKFKDFTETRKILFELMDEGEIIQVLNNGKLELRVK
jgi:type I restriction enzyme S subunit